MGFGLDEAYVAFGMFPRGGASIAALDWALGWTGMSVFDIKGFMVGLRFGHQVCVSSMILDFDWYKGAWVCRCSPFGPR